MISHLNMNISGVIIISVLCLSFSVIGSGQGSGRRQRNRQPSRRGNNRYEGLPRNLMEVYVEAASDDLTPTMSTSTISSVRGEAQTTSPVPGEEQTRSPARGEEQRRSPARGGEQTTSPARGEEQTSTSMDAYWRRFIPSTPTASEVECYVEQFVVVRQGGKCIRLAGMHSLAVCQSGEHVAFVPECEEMVSAREARQNQASSTLQP